MKKIHKPKKFLIDDLIDALYVNEVGRKTFKHQLLQLVLEMIGEDEKEIECNDELFQVWIDQVAELRNQLRQELRQRARELFGEEDDHS